MKVGNFFKSISVSLAIGGLVLASTVSVKADAGDPNGASNTPEQGWSLWKRWENFRDEKVKTGLSQADVEAWMQLEKVCFGEVGTPTTDKKKLETYWYRLNENVAKGGEGEIQYGCWENGRFKSSITVSAVASGTQQASSSKPASSTEQASSSKPASSSQPASSSKPASNTEQASSSKPASSTEQASATGDRCRRVQTPAPHNGLAIRSEPNPKASRIGGVANGETLTLSTNPPTVKNAAGYTWIEVAAPVRGWVNNGGANSLGNLKMCRR